MSDAFQNTTDFITFFRDADQLTSHFLAYGMVITVWIVLFFSAFKYGRDKALTFASFSCFLLLLFMYSASFIAYWLFLADLILLGIGVFGMVWSKK